MTKVNPEDENKRIEHMQLFGWNLKNREEIYRENEQEDEILVEQYVTLHFVRDLNLPNLEEIKKIETEYLDLPFPKIPLLIGHKRAMETREKTLRRLQELSEQLSLLTRKKVRITWIANT